MKNIKFSRCVIKSYYIINISKATKRKETKMNMDYCKYENTLADMRQCLRALEEGRETSALECEKAETLFEEILGTMMDLGIIDEWDGDLLSEFCQQMNEEGE